MIKTIFSLAFKGLRRRRNQTFLILAVLTISFAFAFIVLGYSYSIAATNEAYRAATYGSWHGMIADSTEKDISYIESAEWLEESGTITTYATINSSGIGTVSDSMTDLGISMNSGRLPESEDEIAMEADLLSALGYDYELGQEIEITVIFDTGISGKSVYVKKSYTLCGVITEYSSIWSVLGDTTLNSAIITEDAAKTLVSEANETAIVSGSVSTCFYSVKSGYEDEVASDSYLRSRRAVTNYTISVTNEEANLNILYVAIIFLVSLLAVVVIYILNMPKEVQRTVRMRSIGASKWQILSLIALESLILCIPAIILGTVLGAVGMWLILKLGVYSGSVDIVVSVPTNIILCAGLVWILGILLVRGITYITVLSTPLTGRMTMGAKSKRKSQALQRALINILSLILCFTIVFTALNVIYPAYTYDSTSSTWSYMIANTYATPKVTDETIDLILSVPGITDVQSDSKEDITDITFGTIEIDNVKLVVIDDPSDWHNENTYGYNFDFSNLDYEAFMRGDAILFSVVSDSKLETPEIGESVTIGFDMYSCYASSREGQYILDDGETLHSEITTTVGGVSFEKVQTSVVDALGCSYYIVCSKNFMQKIVDMIPEGYCMINENYSSRYITYVSGEEVGYRSSYIYANSTAEFLSTDAVIASIASNAGLSMNSLREYNYAIAQNWLQRLILLSVSGGCIALVVILILASTVRLESEQEKKKFGVLRAIGMSKNQQRLSFLRQALIRAVSAVVVSWAGYLGYCVYTNRSALSEGGTVTAIIRSYFSNLTRFTDISVLIPALIVGMLLIVSLVLFIPKHRLNKYTLMEMLCND
ncbi:MAG: ABC transporter permease [Ruminococcus sp.]|nr:ABC transporter permease [Ruminococcus sp.]